MQPVKRFTFAHDHDFISLSKRIFLSIIFLAFSGCCLITKEARVSNYLDQFFIQRGCSKKGMLSALIVSFLTVADSRGHLISSWKWATCTLEAKFHNASIIKKANGSRSDCKLWTLKVKSTCWYPRLIEFITYFSLKVLSTSNSFVLV